MARQLPRDRSPYAYVYCSACRKRTYSTKAAARAARNRADRRMHIYRCPEAPIDTPAYHIGHRAADQTREAMRARDDWRRGITTAA